MIKKYSDPKISECGYCYTVKETCEYCGKQWIYDAYNFGNVYRAQPCNCDSSREQKIHTHPFSLPLTWHYYPNTVIKNGERCKKCGAEIGAIKNDIINVCISCGNREYAKSKNTQKEHK